MNYEPLFIINILEIDNNIRFQTHIKYIFYNSLDTAASIVYFNVLNIQVWWIRKNILVKIQHV